VIALKEQFTPANRITELLEERVSPSRLGCWLQCRLKFFFRYVLGLPQSNSPSLHLGKTVHAVLQLWNLARWKGVPAPLAELEASHDALFLDEGEEAVPWESEEERGTTKVKGRSLLSVYLEETNIPFNEKPLGVEVRMEADLQSHGLPNLGGIVDLVRPGGIIVDYKTAAQTPDPRMALHQHETQLTSYALLYRDATGEKEGGVELHHLVKLKKPKAVITQAPPATEGKINRLFRTMESYVSGVQREDFVPSPGLHCSYCPFFAQCRKWEG